MESEKEINMTIPGDMKALGEEAIPENWRRGGQPKSGPLALSSSFTAACHAEYLIQKMRLQNS